MTDARRLERRLGLPGAVIIGLGACLGTGAFGGLAFSLDAAGGGWWLAILSAAAIALMSGLSAGRLAAANPVSGGTYEHATRLLHPSLGRVAGWLFLVAKTASLSAAAHAVAGGFLALAPPIAAWGRPLAAAAVILLLGGLVMGGLRRSVAAVGIGVAIALAGLLAAAVGLRGDERVAVAAPAAAPDLPLAIALAFVAFTGFGRLATMGEEVRNPERTIPRSIVVVVLACAGLYLLVFGSLRDAVDPGELAALARGSEAPLASLAESRGRTILAGAIALAGLAAMGSVGINLLLGMSRVVLAMARRRDLPAAFATIDPGGSPRRAVAAVAVVTILVALATGLGSAWTLSTAAILPYYAITNLAALRLPDPRRIGRPIAIAGLGGTLLVAFHLAWTDLAIALGVSVLLALVVGLLGPSTSGGMTGAGGAIRGGSGQVRGPSVEG